MCLNIMDTANRILKDTIGDLNLYSSKKNDEYKQQVALNQIKTAQLQAQNLRQEGIEKARKEKIEALKNSSSQMAKNASNGFDAISQTNMFQYDDIYNEHFSNASDILENYYRQSESYDTDARNKHNELKHDAEINRYNYLGSTLSVAKKWFHK